MSKLVSEVVALFVTSILLLLDQGTYCTSRSPLVFSGEHSNELYIFEIDESGNRQDLILPCPIINPSLTVNYTWFRGDQELPGSMVNGEGSLIVPNITEGEYASREGVDYYCIARDNIGFDVATRSRSVTVYYAYFDGFKRTAESGESTVEVPIPVALNSDVALECDVLDAKPPPRIKWFNDTGAVQEVTQGNIVRFLDSGRYLYLRRLQPLHLEGQYYCIVTNANLSQEISAPTRYILVDNLTQGILLDYKQIGNQRVFAGNASFEFAYIGGVFGNSNMNGTSNRLFVSERELAPLGNIGEINIRTVTPGIIRLRATVRYNTLTSIVMRTGAVIVQQVPRITNTFEDRRDILVGEDSLMYTCRFEGFPLPNITFYFNGVVISHGHGVTIVGNTLSIPSPQVSHSGIYQCIVNNEFGDDQQAWLLEIRQPKPPKVQPYNFTELNAFDDRELGALIVRPNNSALIFSVNVIADPCPVINWTFNGGYLQASDIIAFNDPCEERTNALAWTFMLNMTITPATSGSYSASLSNVGGTARLPKLYFTIPEPVSVISLMLLNEECLKEGSDVFLRCSIRGFPRPDIEFQLNGVTIIPGNGNFKNYVLEFYDQIAIMNVTVSAGGMYSCLASGQILAEESFNFCSEPIIRRVNRTSDMNLHIGESFYLECAFTGEPSPTVLWKHNGTELRVTVNNEIRIHAPTDDSSRLDILEATSMEFNGRYDCFVSNIAGNTTMSFQITLQGVISPMDQSSSLSTEAISGIILSAVLAVVGVTILVVIIFFVIRTQSYMKGKEEGLKQGREEGEARAKQKLRQKPSWIVRHLAGNLSRARSGHGSRRAVSLKLPSKTTTESTEPSLTAVREKHDNSHAMSPLASNKIQVDSEVTKSYEDSEQ